MGWLSYKNYAKEEKTKEFIHSRWVWFIGSGNKNVSLEVVSTPSFGWGIRADGSEGDVVFQFWFI